MKTGIVFCMECAGLFRGLGTQVSSVRSLLMDSFSDSQLQYVRNSKQRFLAYMSKSQEERLVTVHVPSGLLRFYVHKRVRDALLSCIV